VREGEENSHEDRLYGFTSPYHYLPPRKPLETILAALRGSRHMLPLAS
jgi:hypothetical protein